MSASATPRSMTPRAVDRMGPGGVSPNVRGSSAQKQNWSALNSSGIREDSAMGGALGTYEYAPAGSVTPGGSGPLTVTHSATNARRASDLTQLLVNAEKEIAELREGYASRGAELDSVKAQLQREHETTLRQQNRHQQDLQDLRDEYDRQHNQLIEQITVLKGVSESALDEKRRTAEDAALRKQQLQSLVDREREEKSTLLSDYRAQTEALIAEQGQEITGLRNLLEAQREEEEKMIVMARQQEERRSETEEQILKAENALADERVASQRRLREAENRHATQLQQLRDQHEREENNARQQQQKINESKESIEDANRQLVERVKQQDTNHELERQRLKDSYNADLQALQNELRVTKENRDRMEAKLKAEVDRLTRGDEELIASLRKEIDTVRLEKQSAFADYHREKEASATETQARTAALQVQIDNLKNNLADERSQRKEAESVRQTLELKTESLQGNVSRLQNEVESGQIESRARERTAEQNHNSAIELLRNKIHALESDNAQLTQTNKRLQVELQRESDSAAARAKLIDQLKTEHRQEVELLKGQAVTAQTQYDEQSRQQLRQIDLLQSQRVQLESDNGRLSRGLDEMEARAATAAKQLGDERAALEASMAETQNFKAIIGELKAALDVEKNKSITQSNLANDRETELSLLRSAHEETQTNLRDARHQADRLRSEMDNVSRVNSTAVQELRSAHTQQVDQLRAELDNMTSAHSSAKATATALEDQLRIERDEVNKWQRESISKDELHAEAIRTLRNQEEDELNRMDAIVSGLRDDVSRAQNAKATAQRELADAQRAADRRVALVQEALDGERQSKQRLHDEIRNKEQLAAELQGTVRLLNSRVQSKEDDIRRAENENGDLSAKVHEAHAAIGKKEAVIGQLTAKLRVYESRGTL